MPHDSHWSFAEMADSTPGIPFGIWEQDRPVYIYDPLEG